MGLFLTKTFADGEWLDAAIPGQPFLSVDIHDSDIATITYSSDSAAGLFYLGFQPRDYFEDSTASDDVDLDEQARRLVTWNLHVRGTAIDPRAIRPLLADEGIDEPIDVFVEDTVGRLLAVMSLPIPSDLPAAP